MQLKLKALLALHQFVIKTVYFRIIIMTTVIVHLLRDEIIEVQFQQCEREEGLKGDCPSLITTIMLNAAHCWSL